MSDEGVLSIIQSEGGIQEAVDWLPAEWIASDRLRELWKAEDVAGIRDYFKDVVLL